MAYFDHGKPKYYILQNKRVIPCDDLHQWSVWMESADLVVRASQVMGYTITTAFLGLDYSMEKNSAKPLLFRTVIVSPDGTAVLSQFHSTWVMALMQHQITVNKIQANEFQM